MLPTVANAYSRHRSFVTVSGVVLTCAHKLSPHFHSVAYSRHLRQAYGVGRNSISIRSATSACFSDSSMSVCYFPNSEAHGRHIHDTFLPPIEEKPTAFQLTATFHLTSATPHSTPCRAERIIRSVRVGILPPSIAPPTTPLRFNPRSHEWRGQFVG